MLPKSVVKALACGLLLSVGCSKSKPESPDSADSGESQAAPAGGGVGGVARVADSRPNAATEYAAIHEAMGKAFFDPLVDLSPAAAPTPAEAQYLVSKQDIVERLLKASRIERCDFAIDYRDGIDVFVPQLAWQRHFVQLLNFDAHRLILLPGGRRGATDRLVALFRIARQAGAEPILVSKLVGAACIELGLQSVADWSVQLNDPESRAALRAELEALRAGNVLDGKAALRGELEMLKTSLAKDGPLKLEGTTTTIAPADKPEVLRELEQALLAAEAAWGAPDAESRMRAAQDAIRSPGARSIALPCDQLHKQIRRTQARLDSAIANLK